MLLSARRGCKQASKGDWVLCDAGIVSEQGGNDYHVDAMPRRIGEKSLATRFMCLWQPNLEVMAEGCALKG